MRDHMMFLAILMIVLVSASGQKDTTDQLLAKGRLILFVCTTPKLDVASIVEDFENNLYADDIC